MGRVESAKFRESQLNALHQRLTIDLVIYLAMLFYDVQIKANQDFKYALCPSWEN